MDGRDFVLATIKPPSVFNFYPTREAAEADLPRANRNESEKYAPMTWEEFYKAQRAFYLGDPPAEITEERFHYALEVLPPMRYRCREGFTSFLMSEFHSGPYTHQYVAIAKDGNTRYFSKLVDATDERTWMTAEVAK
jgi:hypothetical protein